MLGYGEFFHSLNIQIRTPPKWLRRHYSDSHRFLTTSVNKTHACHMSIWPYFNSRPTLGAAIEDAFRVPETAFDVADES